MDIREFKQKIEDLGDNPTEKQVRELGAIFLRFVDYSRDMRNEDREMAAWAYVEFMENYIDRLKKA